MKSVGAVGAVVSSLTSWLETVETLPTLSSTTHLTVVVPSAVTSTLAVEALTVVPPEVGSLPSVVYVMRLTPEAPASPAAEMAIDTGEAVYQPAEQAAALHWIELVGALKSPWAVKLVPAPFEPALFCAVTEPLWVVAELENV